MRKSVLLMMTLLVCGMMGLGFYESARFTYSLSSDGTVLTLKATTQGDDYSEMAGVFTKEELK